MTEKKVTKEELTKTKQEFLNEWQKIMDRYAILLDAGIITPELASRDLNVKNASRSLNETLTYIKKMLETEEDYSRQQIRELQNNLAQTRELFGPVKGFITIMYKEYREQRPLASRGIPAEKTTKFLDALKACQENPNTSKEMRERAGQLLAEISQLLKERMAIAFHPEEQVEEYAEIKRSLTLKMAEASALLRLTKRESTDGMAEGKRRR